MPSLITRRESLIKAAQASAYYFLLRLTFSQEAFARPVKPVMQAWLRELIEIAKEVKTGRIPVTIWQDRIETLHRTISIGDLLKYIDFDSLIKNIVHSDKIAAVKRLQFPPVQGFPEDLGFSRKLFAHKKGAATMPHIHNNMVSAHLVLQGTYHVRTFNRISDEDNAVIVRPSIDKPIGVGQTISTSDDRDNGHWFVATSDYAYTLDIPIYNLNMDKTYKLKANEHSILYMDPTSEPRHDGSIRAPILSFEESLKKFGGRSAL